MLDQSDKIGYISTILREVIPVSEVNTLIANLNMALEKDWVEITGTITDLVIVSARYKFTDNHHIIFNKSTNLQQEVQALEDLLKKIIESGINLQTSCPIDQDVEQSGKYGTNIGQGKDIYIGDIYQQPDLEEFRRIVQEELQLQKQQIRKQAITGLNVLVELVQYPQLHLDVVTFRTTLQLACEQINVISNNKILHDLLHTLEFRCCNGILRECKDFPLDDIGLDILLDHELELKSILRKAKEVAQDKMFAECEALWLKNLEQAQEEFRVAMENFEISNLQKTVRLLERILATQPSRINTNLNLAVRILNLSPLIKAMESIEKQLSNLNLDIDKMSEFQTGVRVLPRLNNRLKVLVIAHDHWQEIDLELRRINASIEYDLLDLEMVWPDLRERTKMSAKFSSEDLFVKLWNESQYLEQALSTQNSTRVRRHFRMYRRRASEIFYQIDVTLKELCEELREVGKPLVSVLRIIE